MKFVVIQDVYNYRGQMDQNARTTEAETLDALFRTLFPDDPCSDEEHGHRCVADRESLSRGVMRWHGDGKSYMIVSPAAFRDD